MLLCIRLYVRREPGRRLAVDKCERERGSHCGKLDVVVRRRDEATRSEVLYVGGLAISIMAVLSGW